MSTPATTNLQTSDFAPFIATRAVRRADLRLALDRREPSMKDSVIACAFVICYVGVYLAIGFAVVSAFSWAWTAALG